MKTMSMTGFGEGSAEKDGVAVCIEMKTVNHRFLDVSCKLPGIYSRFENDLIKLIRETLKRGRVELFVGRKDSGETSHSLSFNQQLFGKYMDVLRLALKGASVPERYAIGPAVANVLNRREVVELLVEEKDTTAEYDLLVSALQQALDRVLEMRKIEGGELESEIIQQLSRLEEFHAGITTKAQQTPLDFKQRLQVRLDRLGGAGAAVDPERLAQEVAILADRVDVTEELARLQSHFFQFRTIVEQGQGGRKLEFLLQEIIREINTVGSKAQNAEITSLVVEGKAVVEKLREQIQNIE